MPSTQDIRAGRAFVEVGVTTTELEKGLRRGQQQLRNFGNSIRSIGLGIAGAGAAMFSPLAFAGKSFATAGEQIRKSSEMTGLSAKSYQTLAYAADQVGVSAESLTGGVSRMNKMLEESAKGSKQAEEALAGVGVSFQQLNGMNQEQRFLAIAEAAHALSTAAGTAVQAMTEAVTSTIADTAKPESAG